jgi:dTDP-4-dehydrorhamnose reductase
MRILLFGKNGQVGRELNRSLRPLGEVKSLGREGADFSRPDCLRDILQDFKPDIIVNATAYTAVDKAEDEEDLALLINSEAPRVLAEEALKLKALLVHYSTDYVFNGKKSGPYLESDETEPVNAYGRTKLAGEIAVKSSGCDCLIFRTSWVYSGHGNNFLSTILRLAQERDELNIVSDQIGAPTSARLIADTTLLCLQQTIKERHKGKFSSDLYQLTASGSTSWYGFAEKIVSIACNNLHIQVKVKRLNKVLTSEYQTKASRPHNSRLSLSKLESYYDVQMPGWEDILELSIDELSCAI